MDSYVRPPDPLSGDGDMVQNWDRWRKDFVIYLKASDYAKKSTDIQAYLLRSHIGKVGQDAIDKIFPRNSTDRDKVDVLLNKLSNFYNPPKNEVIERYNFFTRVWKPQESIEDYIEDLKQKAATCNFGNIKNSLIRDKVIAGFKDKNLRKKLFETTNLDLPKLISIHNEHKLTLQEKSQTHKKDTTSAKAVVEAVASSSGNNNNTRKTTGQNQQSHIQEFKRNCWKCAQKHPIKSCPAWGYKCQKCNELHHFTFCCRNAQTNTNLSKPNQYQQNQYPPPLVQTNNMGPPTGYYNTPPPTVPSAPPLPTGQSVYPNLNRNSSSQSQSRSWAEQQNMRSQEILQKSETLHNKILQSRNTPQSQNSTEQSNRTNNREGTTIEGAKNNDDKCNIS